MFNMSNQNVIINDLLSFFISKLNLISKEKLINCINSYYSRHEIIDAKNVLFDHLPTKNLTMLVDDENLITILAFMYDCIKFSIKHLPIFVCRNLNNIPSISQMDYLRQCSDTKDISTIVGEHKKISSDIEDKEWSEEICRQEQLQMKRKISEMLEIIKELKHGIKRFIKSSDRNNDKPKSEKVHYSGKENYRLPKNEKHVIIDEDFSVHILPNTRKKKNLDFESLDLCLETDHLECEIEERKIVLEENPNSGLQIQSMKDIRKENHYPNPMVNPVALITTKNTGQTIISINDGDVSSFGYDDDAKHLGQENLSAHVIEDMDTESIGESDLDENETHSTQEAQRDLRSYAPEKCPICSVPITSKSEYDLHVQEHYSKSTYDCVLCNKKFSSRDGLVDHFLQCVKEERLNIGHSCSICGSFYADQVSFTKHKSLHAECRTFPCSECSFRFFTKKGLNLHTRSQHNPLSKHSCPLCNFSFFSSSSLLTHVVIHTGSRPFSCNLCHHTTDTKKAMKQHLHSHGTSSVRTYNCKECDYICDTNYRLMKHRLLEHREEIQCRICDKKFRNPSTYKKHYELHNSGSNFHCKLCAYSTLFKRYLDKHMLTHPSNSQYTCPKCSVSLSNKHTIGIHLKNYCTKVNTMTNKNNSNVEHQQQNEYKCNLCLYSTSCKQNAEKHALTHPTVTNFFCPKCCIPLSSKHTIGHHLRSYCTKNDDSIIVDEF